MASGRARRSLHMSSTRNHTPPPPIKNIIYSIILPFFDANSLLHPKFLLLVPEDFEVAKMGKIANRQSLAILDRGLKSQPFSQFCCIGVFKTNRQSRVSNRNFRSQGRQRFESRVFKSLAILDLAHFPRFRVRIFRIFRVFVLRNLLRPLFSWGGRDVRIFRIFPVSGWNR